MNQHDDVRDPDHGWVDPAETGLLASTLGAMAGGVDAGSPRGPAAVMPVLRRRVRRRRTAKLGGLGGGALALAAVVALGAAQLAPPTDSEPLPGSSSSPVVLQVEDGYQPPWLEWSDLACGMPVTDLRTTAPGWSASAAGDIYTRTEYYNDGEEVSRVWGIPSTFQEGKGTLDLAPVMVWSQDGVVLNLGPNVFEGGPPVEPLLGSGGGAVTAASSLMTTCVPTPTRHEEYPEHRTPMPDGDYEVRVVAFPKVSGQRATVVSDPVPVRLDADGAHSPGEPRAGGSSIEFPDPAEGQVARFELDRTTDWVTAEMSQLDYSTDAPMTIIGQCVGGDPEAGPLIELVLPSTGEVLDGTGISCDGGEAGTAVGSLSDTRSGEVIEIRLRDVPDDVSRLWVALELDTPTGQDGGPECSATGFEPKFNLENFPTGDIAAAAGNIVMAAMDCDSDALIALAEESGTELMSGTETPEETFALPEPGTEHYRTIAALLSDTRGEILGELVGDVTGDETVVWPRVATEEFRDSSSAWDEVVAAGLITAEEAEAQRADGYQGPRIAIGVDMTWQYYSAGD